jgi:ribosomal protein S7
MKNIKSTTSNTIKILKNKIKNEKITLLDKFYFRKKKLKNCFTSIKFRFLKIKKKPFLFKKNALLFIKHNKKIKINTKTLKLKYFQNDQKKNQILKISRKKFLNFKKFTLINTSTSIKPISYNLYNKFLLFIFRVGKKNIWEQKFSSIFDQLSLKLSYSRPVLLLKIFTRLFTRVEVKKVKARKRITYIPIFIKLARSIFLALKWIFLAALKKKGNISFQTKLFTELLQILTQKSSFSLQKVEENNISAFKNRSNIHYRWQKTR